jgi:hypothetical protein
MPQKNRSIAGIGALAAVLCLSATPAAAYIGPGLGMGVIATIFGSIAAFFMVLAGLVWYPFKVMLRKRREKKLGASAQTAASAAPTPPRGEATG